MSKDLSFRAFLQMIVNEVKQLPSDPFTCCILEYAINMVFAALLAVFIHPLTSLVTFPWAIIRLIYWIWRDIVTR